MKWITNTHDPKRDNAKFYFVELIDDPRTKDEQWNDWLKLLDKHIIGRPKAVPKHTVEELESMHMVGVYKIEE